MTGTADSFTVTKAEMTLTDDETAPASITLTTSPVFGVGRRLRRNDGHRHRHPGRQRDAAHRATEVTVSVGGGSATSGTDYTAVSDFTVTIPKETASASGTFTLTPTQDDHRRGRRDDRRDRQRPTDFTVTKAEMTLTDDETAPASITLTASPTSLGEDDDATTVTVTATLGGSTTLLTARRR